MKDLDTVAISCIECVVGVVSGRLRFFNLLGGRHLEYITQPDDQLGDVMKQVLQVSKRLEVPVLFRFNDKMTTIHPTDTMETCQLRYEAKGEPLLYVVYDLNTGKLSVVGEDNNKAVSPARIGPINLQQLQQLYASIAKLAGLEGK